MTLFFVRSAFILSFTARIASSRSASGAVSLNFFQTIRPHALHFSVIRERHERRVTALQGNPTVADDSRDRRRIRITRVFAHIGSPVLSHVASLQTATSGSPALAALPHIRICRAEARNANALAMRVPSRVTSSALHICCSTAKWYSRLLSARFSNPMISYDQSTLRT